MKKSICPNIQALIEKYNIEIDLNALEDTLERFDAMLKYSIEDGYASLAGCELWQDDDIEVMDDDLLIGSGDAILYDVRCKEGTFGYDHEAPSRVFPVEVIDPETHDIDYSQPPIQRAVTTFDLLSRYKWFLRLFEPYDVQTHVSVFDYDGWKTHADIDAAFNKEIDHLQDDPWLAMYWLLHMWLTHDARYEQVKSRVLTVDFSRCVSSADPSTEYDPHSIILRHVIYALVWFDCRDIGYNLDLRHSNESNPNLFLIRHANLIYNHYAYDYRSPEGFEYWWLSLTLSPECDDTSLMRIRWFANNVEKFNQWQAFDQKLNQAESANTASHPISFLSYALALNPNYTADKQSQYANDFLNELNKSHVKNNKNRFDDFARAMLSTLQSVFTDTQLLSQVMKRFFKGGTSTEEYKSLYNAHFEKNEALDQIHDLLGKIEQQAIKNNAYRESQEIDSEEAYLKIKQHNDNAMAKVTEGLHGLDHALWQELVSNVASETVAIPVVEYLFSRSLKELPNKTELLGTLFASVDLFEDKFFQYHFKNLLKDAQDENLGVCVELVEKVSTIKHCRREMHAPLCRPDFLNQDGFLDKLLVVFDKMEVTESNGFDEKNAIAGTVKKLFDYDDDSLLRHLSKQQVEQVLAKTLNTLIRLQHMPDVLGDVIEACGSQPEARDWLENTFDELDSLSKKMPKFEWFLQRFNDVLASSNSKMAEKALNTEFTYELSTIASETMHSLTQGWQLLPVHTKENHLLEQTRLARKNKAFPDTGVVFGRNDNGHLLVMTEDEPNTMGDTVYVWHKDTEKLTKIADDIADFIYQFRE